MTEATRCPKCGNVLSGDLGGRCPECMLQAGLRTSIAASGPATVDYPAPKPAPPPLPEAGSHFGGYRIIRGLGYGGMGTVFEAEESATGRRLALKVLSHSLDSPTARQRFLREGRLAASVNHPRSVYIYGTDVIGDTPVITMELVRGGTLQDRVRRRGPLPASEAIDAVLQVIDGLEAASAVGVLHRDVKPSNCFVDGDGHVKVGDFGLSISKIGRGDMNLSTSGVFLGTPTFAAPEQLRGDELDQRTDQYAVGVTLYYLLTGKVPFDAEQMVQLVATVLEKPAPDVRKLRPDVPRELALVIHTCLEKDPARRYRNYAELRTALLPFSSLMPVPATPAWRLVAGFIDTILIVLVAKVWAVALVLLRQAPTLESGSGRQLVNIAVGLVILFFYYIVPEGLWGASPAKWLCGLRVAREGTMRPPGLGRSAIRALVYKVALALPAWTFVFMTPGYLVDPTDVVVDLTELRWSADFVNLSSLVAGVLLFITIRRSNGYAGIHDLLSGTRVILKPWAAARPVPTLGRGVNQDPTGTATVGPYHLLTWLGENQAGAWHLAYDTRLLRKVWVRKVAPGTPPVAEWQRDQSRAGRLRWLTGQRGGDENWDAFEAPSGRPLWALLDRPRDWDEVRYWLLDLSEELAAALKDGSLPGEVGLDRVWITAEGRAKLLDMPAPGWDTRAEPVPTAPGEIAPLRGFLRQVAASSLAGRPLDYASAQLETFAFPLPLHARPALEDLDKVERLEVLHADIERHLDRPTRVTWARGWAPVAACFALVLGFALLVGADYLETMVGVAEHPDAPQLKDYLFRHSPPLGIPEQADAGEKALLEVAIAGRFGSRIVDPAFWQNPYVFTRIRPTHEEIAKAIVARTPAPKKEDVDAFVRLLASMHDEPAEEDWNLAAHSPLAVIFFIAQVAFAVIAVIAVPSILCALLFRGGLMWHICGIAAVNRHGQPASRWRLTWRSLVAWLPLLLVPGLIMWSSTPSWVLPLKITMWGVALLIADAVAKRSIVDRLAGTWLVIR
jgi:hypothetical protein